MKTKRKQPNTLFDVQLYNIFKEMYGNEEECIAAIQDAKKAFSFITGDALHRDNFSNRNNE